MSQTEPKVKFVDNLWCAKAISLGWIREIHIDKEYEHHKHLSKIIAHERKHQVFYDKWVDEKNGIKQPFIGLYNNVWDFFSSWRLSFYFDKIIFVVTTALIVSLILAVASTLIRMGL